jgi:hypothetical protein
MSTSASEEEDNESTVKPNSNGNVLRIHIPYFGTINFEPRAGSNSVSRTPIQAESHTSIWVSELLLADQLAGSSYRPCSDVVCPLTPNAHPTQLQTGQLALSGPDLALDELQGSNFDDTSAAQEQTLMTSASVGTYHDWDLQGIDLALFDSLFGSADLPDVDHGEMPTPVGNYPGLSSE